MELLFKKSLFFIWCQLQILILCSGIPYGNRDHFIESPKMSRWGDWGKLEHCPSDQVVIGMKLKVHENQGMKDDTGLNAVKFYCQNPYSLSEYSEDVVGITSLVGHNGEWKKDHFCPPAAPGSPEAKLIAVGFQLRSETSHGVKDDTAGNNLKLVCSDLYQKQGYTYLEGDGTKKGEWTERQLCWPGYAICGLQTQVEITAAIDTTGLNNLKVRCCRVESGLSILTATVNETQHAHSHHSGDSGSVSSQESGEGSGSTEKDNNGQIINHGTFGEGINRSGESQEYPEEQELTAIVDPEPSAETETVTTNHTEVHSPSSSESHEVNREHNSASDENDDDNSLPEEIAQIDQVDNSEAHNDQDENMSTATDSQQIPEEVVNALEDADSADTSSNGHESRFPHHYNDNAFHWGTELTDSSKIAESNEHQEGSNALDDEEPQSSPSAAVQEVSNQATSHVSHFTLMIVGPVTLLYITKLF